MTKKGWYLIKPSEYCKICGSKLRHKYSYKKYLCVNCNIYIEK